MFDWINYDAKILLLVRSINGFATSFVSIFIAVYLKLLGFPIWQVGVILTGGLLSSTFFNLLADYLADHVGRRKLLIYFGAITTLSGIVFFLSTSPMILVPIAIISSLGYRGGFSAPQMLERVILAQSCPPSKRTRVYAIRSTLSSVAISIGSLFTGMVVILQNRLSLTEISSYQWMFGVYAFINLIVIFLYSLLTEDAEIKVKESEQPPLSPETRKYVLLLSALFSIDALGGSFLTQSLVAYWFFERFGLGMDTIGIIFSASSILAALSFMLAARLSERIGLINTMVFSHLPANLMMAAIPYVPSLEASLFLYLGRSILSQMDVPTRQSYTMAIVKPEERSRVQGLINLPRSLTLTFGPAIAGYIMQFIGLSLPFLLAGLIKVGYDVALWLVFKDIKPPEEE
jgi:MFS family permease